MSTESTLPRLPDSSRGYKIATIGFGILLSALMLLFVVQQWRDTYKIVQPAKHFSEYLNDHGAKAKEPQPPTHAVQTQGGQVYEIDVNGQPVWLIYFDTADKAQVDAEAAIKKDPHVEVDGKSRPVKIHNAVVLIGYDGRPEESELLKALENCDKP